MATAALIASTAVNMYSAYSQATAAQDAANTNASLASAQATATRAAGAQQAGAARAKGAAMAGQAATTMAAGGIGLDSPTAANIFATDASNSELDAQTARNNASRQAWGYEVQANEYRTQASYAGRQTWLGPLAAGLNGVASAFGYNAKNKGGDTGTTTNA